MYMYLQYILILQSPYVHCIFHMICIYLMLIATIEFKFNVNELLKVDGVESIYSRNVQYKHMLELGGGR